MNSTLCCSNSQYCIVNATWGVQCCELGSTCGSRCDASHYFANTTKAVTTTLSFTLESATKTLTSLETTTTVTASSVCSPRSCTSTQYLCASSFGGGCCPYGYDCASGGNCIGTSTTESASTSTSVSALVSPLPSGCTVQGQTRCTAGAGISGSGCCDAGYACVTASASLMCSATPTSSSGITTATAPGNVTVEHTSSGSGLSTGAKAGVAVGVILAAALIIGVLTWFCIRRRRRGGRSTITGNEMRSVPPDDNNTPAAGVYSGGGGGVRPNGVGAAGRNLSESGYAPSSTQVSRDYLSGPYSDRHPSIAPYHDEGDANNNTWESAAATAGTPAHEQHPPRDMALHGPDDVLAPIEMGHGGSSRARPQLGGRMAGAAGSETTTNRGRGYSHTGSDGSHSELADTAVARAQGDGRHPSYQGGSGAGGGGGGGKVRDSIAGRFELYGGETPPAGTGGGGTAGTGVLPQPLPTPGSELSEFGTPSPMSREEEQHPRREV